MFKKSDNMSNLLGRKTETGVAGAVGQRELPEVTSFHELGLGIRIYFLSLINSLITMALTLRQKIRRIRK